ncbi:MAG TPA: DNA mismatch repair endonuclease MutL [Armatimonadota bacterium]|nr:DNA mismatch repair endonuclease MutL [Armatimonadota bacterium]
MSVIILDDEVINQIAAGEVIERPASVVKELVENSLDAGATRISIDLEQGGRRLIRVTDDGCGMTREDAVLALQRHATSKLTCADDLFAIRTLGFRGEALPSIAAVSHLKIVTRPHDATEATEIVVRASEVTDLHTAGAPPGTEVTVGRLFFNTPARLKFLRSEASELSHITELVTRFSFSHPQVSLRLTHGEREVVHRPAADDLLSSVVALYGRDAAERLIPVELRLPLLRVSGFVSRPDFTRSSRSHQALFVNRRQVRSRTLTHAVEEPYRSALAGGRFPVAVVMVDVDPALVDVNVHPAKAEVRFVRDWEVHEAVRRAVREALEGTALAGAALGAGAAPPATFGGTGRGPTSAAPAQPTLDFPAGAAPAPPAQTAVGLVLAPLGQVRATYIIAENADGLMIVDQHRAHERVLFERLETDSAGAQPASQGLVMPLTVHLGRREAELLERNLETFAAVGMTIEPFGGDAFVVRAMPALMAKADPEVLLRDLLEELAGRPSGQRLDLPREAILAAAACHAAIKAGTRLAPQEMVELLDGLARSTRPFTCPHGQPIIMTITNFELDRRFQR